MSDFPGRTAVPKKERSIHREISDRQVARTLKAITNHAHPKPEAEVCKECKGCGDVILPCYVGDTMAGAFKVPCPKGCKAPVTTPEPKDDDIGSILQDDRYSDEYVGALVRDLTKAHSTSGFLTKSGVRERLEALVAKARADLLTRLEEVVGEPHVTSVGQRIGIMGDSVDNAFEDSAKAKGYNALHAKLTAFIHDERTKV
jgi:hypothetical protein